MPIKPISPLQAGFLISRLSASEVFSQLVTKEGHWYVPACWKYEEMAKKRKLIINTKKKITKKKMEKRTVHIFLLQL
jgi:hypothetical protein